MENIVNYSGSKIKIIVLVTIYLGAFFLLILNQIIGFKLGIDFIAIAEIVTLICFLIAGAFLIMKSIANEERCFLFTGVALLSSGLIQFSNIGNIIDELGRFEELNKNNYPFLQIIEAAFLGLTLIFAIYLSKIKQSSKYTNNEFKFTLWIFGSIVLAIIVVENLLKSTSIIQKGSFEGIALLFLVFVILINTTFIYIIKFLHHKHSLLFWVSAFTGVYCLSLLSLFISQNYMDDWFVTAMMLKMVSALLILTGSYRLQLKHFKVTENNHDELEKYREKFFKISETIFEALLLTKDQVIIEANKKANEISGFDKTEIIGKNIFSFIAPESHTDVKIKLINRSEEPFQVFGLHKNGSKFFAEVQFKNFLYSTYELNIIAFRDITVQRRAEVEWDRMNLELKGKMNEFEQFAYVISHDFRVPLFSIVGFSAELGYSIAELKKIFDSNNLNEKDKEKADFLFNTELPSSIEYIKSSLFKMSTLISALQNYAVLTREALVINKINMNELIKDVLEEHKNRISENNIIIELNHLPECLGDKSKVRMVFNSIIDNALKYLSKERIGKVKINASIQNIFIVYSIEDNGIGIDKEHLNKIFEIFHRLNPDLISGVGIGLNMAKKIVEKHGGSIKVESESNIGTKVLISLPHI